MNVTPAFPAQDHAHLWPRDADLCCDLTMKEAGLAQGIDSFDVAQGELGRPVALTSLVMCDGAPSTLGIHVADIVSLRAEEQVIWIDARRVVAFVENEQFRRDRPIDKFPGDSVSTSALASATVRHNAVAPLGFRAEPPPATPGLVHPIPEVFA